MKKRPTLEDFMEMLTGSREIPLPTEEEKKVILRNHDALLRRLQEENRVKEESADDLVNALLSMSGKPLPTHTKVMREFKAIDKPRGEENSEPL